MRRVISGEIFVTMVFFVAGTPAAFLEELEGSRDDEPLRGGFGEPLGFLSFDDRCLPELEDAKAWLVVELTLNVAVVCEGADDDMVDVL